MNEWIIFISVGLGALTVLVGYALGTYGALKDIEIEKIKTERDMYEQRLREWSKNQKNF